MFAGAPGDRARFFNFGFEWAEASAFVGTVTERLALGASAGAPPIGSGFDFLDDGTFLKNNGITHDEMFSQQRRNFNVYAIKRSNCGPKGI
jgi:hypothetical protein